ncbi:hypothetical protein DD238_001873 [Peronospora effusa]|uniref:Uncharacterized protein n=1 Tax=Peronospora effusa TaxID=542832 RepID=A0A3M6VUC1_9STRA|nr:hypothetical protein DD238_001873 [Peronospora effusa]RQM17163.1 hypothetical protein DD237_002526 [Peronospora effusa]
MVIRLFDVHKSIENVENLIKSGVWWLYSEGCAARWRRGRGALHFVSRDKQDDLRPSCVALYEQERPASAVRSRLIGVGKHTEPTLIRSDRLSTGVKSQEGSRFSKVRKLSKTEVLR